MIADERSVPSEGEDKVTEQDLRTLVREFQANVFEAFRQQKRRTADFQREVRDRITMAERAMLNAVMDATGGIDRRLTALERHAVDADARLDAVDDGVQEILRRLPPSP